MPFTYNAVTSLHLVRHRCRKVLNNGGGGGGGGGGRGGGKGKGPNFSLAVN